MAVEGGPVGARIGIRIGDAERDRAADVLGAHFRAGRLDATEYDERVQVAFGARTAAELTPLFADLPDGSPLTSAPRPPLPRRSSAARRPVGARRPVDARRLGPGVPRVVVLLLIVAAVIAFTAVAHFPPFFLIPLLWFGFGRRFGRIRRGYGYDYGYGGSPGRR